MSTAELEVTLEVNCIRLPGTQWGQHGAIHLGIQRDKNLIEAVPADRKRIVFRPVLRARRNPDGSANFLGPFAQGPRTERFVYLVWANMPPGAPPVSFGRIKLHLNHLDWKSVQKAAAAKRPIKVTVELLNAKGQPVFASVRPDVAKWEL